MEIIKVVAAIFVYQSRIGLFRRSSGRLAGYWEFPGGKIEPGETPEEALARELYEELDLHVVVGPCIGVSRGLVGDKIIELTAYRIQSFTGEFVLRDHDALVWQEIDQINIEQISPLDRPFLNLKIDKE